MEAAAEGAVGLSEARDGSPLSDDAAASDDGDAVVGDSYGMDAADMGKSTLFLRTPARPRAFVCVFFFLFIIIISTTPTSMKPESPDSSLLAQGCLARLVANFAALVTQTGKGSAGS